jgi:hypothetical protein
MYHSHTFELKRHGDFYVDAGDENNRFCRVAAMGMVLGKMPYALRVVFNTDQRVLPNYWEVCLEDEKLTVHSTETLDVVFNMSSAFAEDLKGLPVGSDMCIYNITLPDDPTFDD